MEWNKPISHNNIERMIDNKNMSVDNVESTSKKMNGVEWRMKWN